MFKTKRIQSTCSCKAYDFPHRENSGRCGDQKDARDYARHTAYATERERLGRIAAARADVD